MSRCDAACGERGAPTGLTRDSWCSTSPLYGIASLNAQTIYAWRLADVRRILRFSVDYPSARRVMLATNYRCPRPVVNASARLVATNVERFAKPIRAPDEADRIWVAATIRRRDRSAESAKRRGLLSASNDQLAERSSLLCASLGSAAVETTDEANQMR